MSWFQDLAGKAENILNQIDQNAANVLLKADDKKKASQVDVPKEVRLEIQPDEQPESSIPARQLLRTPDASPRAMMSLKKSTSSASMDRSFRRTPEVVVERIVSSEQAYPLTNSNSTSRRSSVSSRADLMGGEQPEVVPSRFSSTSSITTSLNVGVIKDKSELDDALERLQFMQVRANAAELELDSVRAELGRATDSFQKTLAETEAKLLKLTHSDEELRQQLQWSKQEADQAKNELQQYRSRAHSTLQLKDQLIEKLKSTSESQSSHPTANVEHILELDHLRSEKAALLDETRVLSEQLVQVRGYVDRLESVQRSQQDEFDLKLEELTRSMRDEEGKWRDYEVQNKAQMRELLIVRDEMARLQSEFASQLHVK